MEDRIERALETDRTIDITTTGRSSGVPRRVEIWFHNLDGVIYITGTPGTRDWYANLMADPSFTFHLKESARVDLEATAIPVTDPDQRGPLLTEITRRVGSARSIEEWLQRSPLVRVEFE